MRVAMRRRSVSSLVSPGPRVPMPPPRRESAWPCPESRGSMYFNCASSTCRRPSAVRARRAKISRINCVRSMTLIPIALSRLRCCVGVRSWSTISTSALVRLRQFLQFLQPCRVRAAWPHRRRAAPGKTSADNLRAGAGGQFRQFAKRFGGSGRTPIRAGVQSPRE